MDFVVFGLGLGAILMLVGFALRDLGPWLFGAARQDEALPEFDGVKATIRKQTLSSVGNAISVGGAGVAAVTFSALLAKADDDLGAIVVGMALVLATVGVGAWTYDIFRRYRLAMEIVASQEEAARQRLAPRQKRRRPKPAPTERPAPEVTGPPSVDTDLNRSDREVPVAASNLAGQSEPTGESLAQEIEIQPWGQKDDEPHDADDAVAEMQEHVAGAVPAPPLAEAPRVERFRPPVPQAESLTGDAEPDPVDHDEKPRSPEPYALPPLPEEPDDALIDESVPLEPRTEPKRQVPSWLFEDLEADLAAHSPAGPEDPIDHFQDARPVTRPSALDRLLSDDGVNREPGGRTGAPQPRRSTSRDDD